MDSILEGIEQLERELTPEPIRAPAAGSLILHAALFGGILAYGIVSGFIHHNFWGNPGPGSAIQVSLDSSSIPLPSDQPKNENVLPTEKPSPAPAPPTPKAKQAVDESAIPIQGKEKKLEKQKQIKTPKTPPKEDNRIQYGEQAGSKLSRSTYAQGTPADQPASVSNGDFGTRFGWYVDGINHKMAIAWDKREVDPSTPKGARVYLVFTIVRDGSPQNVQIDRSSGSSTLDRSCQRGVQRVDTFGQLPAAYNASTLKVSYYCEY